MNTFLAVLAGVLVGGVAAWIADTTISTNAAHAAGIVASASISALIKKAKT